MTHRAESIMVNLTGTLTGLATTGASIKRGRSQPVAADGTPALTLEQGPDNIFEDNVRNTQYVDRLLNFRVIAYVKTNSQFDTLLNTIREEVYIALMTDRQQGLPTYVFDTLPLGDEDPELTGELEKGVGRQVMNFAIKYRHSVTNPGA